MITIYCIEDINDMKYVGSTKQPLNRRLSLHKSNKRAGQYCSSGGLHLEHSVIYELETCQKNERKNRERYWINEIDCVNIIKLTYDRKEYKEQYHQRNKDRLCREQRDYYQRCKISKFLKILQEY